MACRSGCATQDHGSWCKSTVPAERQSYFAGLFEAGRWRCSPCGEELPLSAFYLRKSGRGAGKPTAARCKDCAKAAGDRTGWQYNVSYDELLESQGGRCALCGATAPGGKGKFHVDHDHSCCPGRRSCGSCVRGLLCVRCNSGIGYFDDNPDLLRKAIDYVSR